MQSQYIPVNASCRGCPSPVHVGGRQCFGGGRKRVGRGTRCQCTSSSSVLPPWSPGRFQPLCSCSMSEEDRRAGIVPLMPTAAAAAAIASSAWGVGRSAQGSWLCVEVSGCVLASFHGRRCAPGTHKDGPCQVALQKTSHNCRHC